MGVHTEWALAREARAFVYRSRDLNHLREVKPRKKDRVPALVIEYGSDVFLIEGTLDEIEQLLDRAGRALTQARVSEAEGRM